MLQKLRPGQSHEPSHVSNVCRCRGRVEDRYRSSSPAQAFGYTSGVLADLYHMTDLLKNAGFDTLGYRGTDSQSIEMAAQYCACYGKYVGFKKPVTAGNARACPNYQQYVGQIVNGLETGILMGAVHFPRNAAITELEVKARSGAGINLIDPLHFGRWRD